MPGRSSAERRAWTSAVGALPGPRHRMRDGSRPRPSRRGTGRSGQGLRPRGRRIHEGRPRQTRRRDARLALDRARIRASQAHYFRAQRLAAAERHEEALVEYQLAGELNPTDANVESAIRTERQKLRARAAVSREGKTELQALVERSRNLAPPGLDLPTGVTLPDSLVFSNASSRLVFTALGRFANVNLIFDPGFRDAPISADLRNTSFEDALTSVAASTHTFYRVTAPKTVTIIPDSPAKRREYEEAVVRTFYLSNADIKEVIDLLRVVVDVRQIRRSPRPTRSRSRTRPSASRRRRG